MSEQFTNQASTTLNGTINNSTTSVVVTSATGFPSSGNFRILVRAEGGNTDEIMTVTSVSGTTFTVTRASESIAGTQSASAHNDGASVVHVLTAAAIKTPGATMQRVNLATGNITLLASQSSFVEASSALRLTIPAIAGDVIDVQYAGIMACGNTSGEISLDIATLVSGSITNRFFSGGTNGLGGYVGGATLAHSISFSGRYQVVSGDISGGNVTITIVYKSSVTVNSTLYAGSTYSALFSVVNIH